MEVITIFFYTFALVFVGELGDKTQIAAGTGTLANRTQIRIIFFSSALALVVVAGLTVFFAGLIPHAWIPFIQKAGGLLLVCYGCYLFLQAGTAKEDGTEELQVSGWKLFLTHFLIVFIAELGDKTQIVTLAVAIENQALLSVVFGASAAALVSVTALTVWGITKVPRRWITPIQRIGAALMSLYGIHMLVT